ncbi:MAG: hypothetical protein A2Y03_09765 [Omnitrophica WOR_2 bacterium GWF2_38_59]|nr:MAG: hypothetical protein A2Y03_09765 [Omnitrophica WOR_2 bacterium GWF2_38_59]OGX47529.1 MAG: hypothetical protein A2243_04490 [Omnitrophica WOR_2 bacterium RIFOXYA2_FULL_38_17]OGX52681.1 MAG: hypothetical protein A2267_09160 [Omnitrophica WOR_2 bacterium RIFOXYA12_FULL_38_10]OGX58186.1 MAG: hypothetical protein A2447_00105 [Omnitrophica WOR_2 bacterium RIFOXYC2_FULL_38_12]OGX58642.1 MAG: hypothetical protein A2306_10330 [Omnitrophica WOR_2 bacterium RIFOXYB2_FULL_38_16]HBG61904.1 hypothet
MTTREVFSFLNKKGLKVKGIVFVQDGRAANKTGIIYLPGIVLGSTAVHRLGVDIACEFQSLGYSVLLFDHSRIGESEGELSSGSSQEFANFVKRGELVDDTKEAISEFCLKYSLSDVVLIGHCGGALNALYTSEDCALVKKMILLSPPLIGENYDAKVMTKGQSDEFLKLYSFKLFSWDAWKRLLSGKSDYLGILKTLRFKIKSSLKNKDLDVSMLNKRFIDGLKAVSKKKEIAIVYGDRDIGFEEFKSNLDLFKQWDIETRILPDTSHGFVTKESISLLFEELKEKVNN